MNELSRRSFFKLGASAALGMAMLNFSGITGKALAQGTTPKNLKFKPVSLKDLPAARAAADSSELVHRSLNYIKSSVNKISDTGLRAKTMNLIEDSRPTFMQLYSSATDITNVYNKLADAGLVKSDKISPEHLFPPIAAFSGAVKRPPDFLGAPGSGYGSHHAYPGGLCTHVASNLSITEGIVNTYKNIFGYEINNDIALSGQALHDLAKPWVFQWNEDGSSLPEYTIADTGAHHTLSIAEAMFRGMPAEEVVAQACAHNHPGSPKDEAVVVGYIKAAAIIAQKDPVSYGVLDKTGNAIPTPHQQEGYIVHLGDHDWVLSVDAAQQMVKVLKEIAQKDYGFTDSDLSGAKFNNFRNYIGSQVSFMLLHNLLAKNGINDLRRLVSQIVVK